MTTSFASGIPPGSGAMKQDDLTVIKGIGPARQRWLKEVLGVHTWKDLAALSADEIEARLKTEGQVVSRNEIERWLAQARDLAARPIEEIGPAETKEPLVAAIDGEWKPFASFVVEFQARQGAGRQEVHRTTVHHMEADRSERWPGIETTQLCQWMLDQISEHIRPELEAEPPAETEPVAASYPVSVEMTRVQAFQPADADMPVGRGEAGEPFLGIVRSDQPFALQISFTLSRPAVVAELADRQITYRAQFHAHSLSTGVTTHLGDVGPLPVVAGKRSYTAALPAVSLGPGMYRLQIVASLQGIPSTVGYLEVPLFQVV